MTASSSKTSSQTIPDILREVGATVDGGGDVTIGNLLYLFGVRGFAFLIFILALLNVVIFMVPGLSLLFGLPLVILTVQMVLGLRTPLFPAFVRRRTISRALLKRGLEISIGKMERIEHLFRPRFWLIAGAHMDRAHSLLALLMAVLMTIPIPFLNLPPSFGLIALALGIMQRDGAFILASYLLAGWSLWLFSSLGHVAHALAQ